MYLQVYIYTRTHTHTHAHKHIHTYKQKGYILMYIKNIWLYTPRTFTEINGLHGQKNSIDTFTSTNRRIIINPILIRP